MSRHFQSGRSYSRSGRTRKHPPRPREYALVANEWASSTIIQRLLGHRDLNSTMIYARVHDRNVAKDYYQAMQKIEGKE